MKQILVDQYQQNCNLQFLFFFKSFRVSKVTVHCNLSAICQVGDSKAQLTYLAQIARLVNLVPE